LSGLAISRVRWIGAKVLQAARAERRQQRAESGEAYVDWKDMMLVRRGSRPV
jgi:hypothetical protein